MTQSVCQSLAVALYADVLDADIPVKQDKVYPCLPRLSAQQIGHTLQKLSNIKVFILGGPTENSVFASASYFVAQGLNICREIVETSHRAEQS